MTMLDLLALHPFGSSRHPLSPGAFAVVGGLARPVLATSWRAQKQHWPVLKKESENRKIVEKGPCRF
jgi:hypothetical protein